MPEDGNMLLTVFFEKLNMKYYGTPNQIDTKPRYSCSNQGILFHMLWTKTQLKLEAMHGQKKKIYNSFLIPYL